VKKTADGAYVIFGGMTWPVPGTRFEEAEYRLRYGRATTQDIALAASVMAAYRQMVGDPEAKLRYVMRNVRVAMTAQCEGEGRT